MTNLPALDIASKPIIADEALQTKLDWILARHALSAKDYQYPDSVFALCRNLIGRERLDHSTKRQLHDRIQAYRTYYQQNEMVFVANDDEFKSLQQFISSSSYDYFLVMRSDEYLGEYVPAYSERLKWVSGFTGSAGWALIGRKKSCLFVDGRYHLQAQLQIDKDRFDCKDLSLKEMLDWLNHQNPSKSGDIVIGYDAMMIDVALRDRLKNQLETIGASLEAVSKNPIDKIWQEFRPPPPLGMIKGHDDQYNGEPANQKIMRYQEYLRQQCIDMAVIADPTQIAWLLNVRGNDVPHCPLSLSRLLVMAGGQSHWFLEKDKLAHFDYARTLPFIAIHDEDDFFPFLEKLTKKKRRKALLKAMALKRKGDRFGVSINPKTTPAKIYDLLIKVKKLHISLDDDYIIRNRAQKNLSEQKGMVNAHRRDGHALCRFLYSLYMQEKRGFAGLDEVWVSDELLKLREEEDIFQGPSFDTIAGYGANGAIIHYRANKDTALSLKKGGLLLIDSGGQYLDGTTDVTRTIALGVPTKKICKHFTLVLKGHIALAKQIFPKGTRGSALDILARKPLWQEGLNYAHGTGHGVGSYSNVHEGPQVISSGLTADPPLQVGMVVSNEPGYYEDGQYGIRIENLVMVKQVDNGYLGFETLTLAPIDQKLIVKDMLSASERSWLNDYHKKVYNAHYKRLNDDERQWLEMATKAI